VDFVKGTKRKKREGVWELRVYVGTDPVKGTPRQISKTFHGNSREADRVLRDLVDKHGEGRPDGFGATVGQLLDKWLEECERMELSPTTMRTYRAQIEQTIRPQLGRLVLARLTPKHLDNLYGAMKDNGLSPKTIRNHHAIISSALHQAVRWEWVRENVAEKARPPRVSQRRVKAPSVAPLLMLAALTGMRRGELCALRWTDVDLVGRELDVSRSVVVVPGGVTEKTTKTDRFRKVALDDVGLALLTHHRANVEDLARHAEVAVAADSYVFSHAVDGSKPFRPDNVTGFFTRVRDSLGLREVRLHDLRHFTATQLIGAGVDVRTVAGRLGHSDPSVTLRVYSHALEERDRAAADIMGRVLGATNPTELDSGGRKSQQLPS
jgi:integrase